MSKQDINRLRSRDPAERKAAIRAVAKATEQNALKQLALMARDDPDKEIRKLAAQAVTYIRRQLGDDSPSAGEPEDNQAGKKPSRVGVSEQDEAKAQRAMGMAQTFLMQDDKAKVASLLRKALELNPNLRHDGYLISMAEEVTGIEGAKAVAMLGDQSQFKAMAEKDAAATRGRAAVVHENEIMSTGWGDVIFDVGLLTVIAVIGAVIAFFLIVESAQRYQDNLEQNWIDVAEALAEGGTPRVEWRAGTSRDSWGDIDKIHRVNPSALPPGGTDVTFTVMLPEEKFMNTVEEWKDAEAGKFAPPGLALGFASSVAAFFSALLIHFFAQVIFRGHGRLPHTVHSITMVFVSRIILLFVILYAGIVLGFSQDGGVVITGVLGVLGAFALVLVLSIANAVAKACDQGFTAGFIATVFGLAPAVAVGVFIAMQTGVLTLGSS